MQLVLIAFSHSTDLHNMFSFEENTLRVFWEYFKHIFFHFNCHALFYVWLLCVYCRVRIINPEFTCWANLMLQFDLNFPQIGIVSGIQFCCVITTLKLSTKGLWLNCDISLKPYTVLNYFVSCKVGRHFKFDKTDVLLHSYLMQKLLFTRNCSRIY